MKTRKATAEFNRTSCYVITDSEDRQIGVIISDESNIENKYHTEDITKRIELAVKEHEQAKSATICDDIDINNSYRPLEFSCDTITEDDEAENRSYTITPSCLYGKE